jgi:hypothetical protein
VTKTFRQYGYSEAIATLAPFVRRNIDILHCDITLHGMAETRFATMATPR